MTATGIDRTLVIEPVTFDSIVVPVDGSALSTSALRPAAALARTVLGSEAAAIIRTSPVPVLVVPPHF